MFKLRVFLLVLCMAGLFLALLATASPRKLTREHPRDVSAQMRGQNAVSLAPSGTVQESCKNFCLPLLESLKNVREQQIAPSVSQAYSG
jgi:hypothetical protein